MHPPNLMILFNQVIFNFFSTEKFASASAKFFLKKMMANFEAIYNFSYQNAIDLLDFMINTI
jgi:hypothetical protein